MLLLISRLHFTLMKCHFRFWGNHKYILLSYERFIIPTCQLFTEHAVRVRHWERGSLFIVSLKSSNHQNVRISSSVLQAAQKGWLIGQDDTTGKWMETYLTPMPLLSPVHCNAAPSVLVKAIITIATTVLGASTSPSIPSTTVYGRHCVSQTITHAMKVLKNTRKNCVAERVCGCKAGLHH